MPAPSNGVVAFKATEARLAQSEGGRGPAYSTFIRLTDPRHIQRFQEHIGSDRRRHTDPAFDPGHYAPAPLKRSARADFPEDGRYGRGGRTVPTYAQMPNREDRGHSNPHLYSPRVQQTTLYTSQFNPPKRTAVAHHDRFGKRESGGQFYALHGTAEKARAPPPGAYNIPSPFDLAVRPSPNLSRAMKLAITRTSDLTWMPVAAQKPIMATTPAPPRRRSESARGHRTADGTIGRNTALSTPAGSR